MTHLVALLSKFVSHYLAFPMTPIIIRQRTHNLVCVICDLIHVVCCIMLLTFETSRLSVSDIVTEIILRYILCSEIILRSEYIRVKNPPTSTQSHKSFTKCLQKENMQVLGARQRKIDQKLSFIQINSQRKFLKCKKVT